MSDDCSLKVEDVFGPIVRGCGTNFDFTLLFEETVLFIGPICLALIVAPLNLRQLSRRKVVLRRGWLYAAKLMAYGLQIIVQAVLIAVIAALNAPRTSATLASVSIGIIGSMVLMAVSCLEHDRSPRPSTLLCLYYLAAVPMNILRARTMWSMMGNGTPTIAFIVYTVLVVVTLVLELCGKRSSFVGSDSAWTTEEMSGIVEQAFMTWMFPLFKTGYQKKLKLEDLPLIDSKLSIDHLSDVRAGRINVSRSLLMEIFKSHQSELLSPVLPRLLFMALQFAQAFLVRRATQYIELPVEVNTYKNGGGLIAAYILVYLGIAVTNSVYLQRVAHVTTSIRAGLVSQIYRRSLELDIASGTEGASTTLMSTDVDRVQQGFRRVHDLWSNFTTAAIGLWLVETELGVSMVVSLGLSLACVLGNFVAAKLASGHQKVWLRATEMRITKTVKVLTRIKEIKMTGCGEAVRKMITTARTSEIGLSQNSRAFLIITTALAYLSLTMSPALVVGIHAVLARNHPGQLLDASTAFTALTLFGIVSSSLTQALNATFQFMTTVGSVQRIQKFLTQHAHIDPRQLLGQAPDNGPDRLSTVGLVAKDTIHSPNSGYEEKVKDDAVRLHNVKVKYKSDEDLVLDGISISIPRNRLTVIAGPTGCGKSTLLKTILGEVRYVSGLITVSEPRIGYCEQRPWIANTSIRDNIIGASLLDEARYRTALHACSLEQDLAELEKGDETICSSGGTSLSGGQKARVALARVLYATHPIAMLDDCLSGLDATTERRVLDTLFGPNGVLRHQSVTTIMATSSSKHLAWADNIILLNAAGKVVWQTNQEELSKTTSELQQVQLLDDGPKYSGNPSISTKAQPSVLKLRPNMASARMDAKHSSRAVYRRICQAAGYYNLLIFGLLATVFVTGSTYPQVYLESWSDRSRDEQRETLSSLLGVYFGVSLAAWTACCGATAFFMLRILPAMSAAFHAQLLDTMLSAPMSFFTLTDNGEIINRFSQDLSMIDRDVPFALIGVVVTLLGLIAQAIVIVIGSNYSGIAIPVIMAAIVVIQKGYLKTSRQLRLLDLETKAPLFTQFLESLNGLATLRAFGWIPEYAYQGIAAMKRAQPPFYLLWSAQNTLILVLNLINAMLAIVIISVAVGSRTSSSGGLGLALFNVVGLGSSLRDLILNWTNLEVALGAVARICDFTSNTASENETRDRQPPDQWPRAGAIHLDNIKVSYSDSLPPVIPGLTLAIKPGAKLGICGRTGSGKSTLLSSLLRLVDLQAGSITVDGLSLDGLNKDAVRSRFVVVPQEPLILHGTLRENANIRGAYEDQVIVAAMQRIGLWKVFEQQKGLETILKDDILSHGQRQALSFALATLQKSSIVVLDEPTSQVDTDIQGQIHRAIFDDLAACTVLCVTHRLEGILDFDIVAVMQQGRVVELDSPRSLLERREPSIFSQLYNHWKQEELEEDESAVAVSPCDEIESGSIQSV